MKKIKTLILLAALSLTFAACQKDDEPAALIVENYTTETYRVTLFLHQGQNITSTAKTLHPSISHEFTLLPGNHYKAVATLPDFDGPSYEMEINKTSPGKTYTFKFP